MGYWKFTAQGQIVVNTGVKLQTFVTRLRKLHVWWLFPMHEQLETGGKCYFKISYCTSVITNDTRILNVRIESKNSRNYLRKCTGTNYYSSWKSVQFISHYQLLTWKFRIDEQMKTLQQVSKISSVFVYRRKNTYTDICYVQVRTSSLITGSDQLISHVTLWSIKCVPTGSHWKSSQNLQITTAIESYYYWNAHISISELGQMPPLKWRWPNDMN